MIAIYKRELKSFYGGMMGYLLDAFFILVGGLYFTAVNLQGGYSYFSYTLYNTCFVFLIFVPVLTMRSFAEERHNKTDQLLLTSPVSLRWIVMGKYLALMTVFVLPLAVLSVCPLLLRIGGEFSNLSNYSAIFGYFLLGAACIAIGMFVSSLTENQIIAVLGTFAILLLTYLMSGIRTLFTTGSSLALIVFTVLLLVISLLVGLNSKSLSLGCMVFVLGGAVLLALFKLKSAALTTAFSGLLGYLSIFDPFQNFVGDLFSITSIVYYLSVAGLFLFLTGQSLEKRRWN